MKMRSFCLKKFKSMLLSATIIMIVVIVLQISDLAIAGNIIGEDAVAAINLLRTPFMFVLGLCSIISQGSSLIYSLKMGEFDKESADRIFGQGLICSFILSALVLVTGVLGLGYYLDFIHASSSITSLALEYCVYFIPVLAVYPIYMYLAAMVYTDGDESLSLIANVFLILGNIGLSILFALNMGIAGIALGSLIGVLFCTIVTSLHFFKKANSLKPRIFVTFKSLCLVAKFSFVDAGIYVYFALQGLLITKLIVNEFGDKYLAVYSVVVSIWQLTLIFDGVGQAFCPLVNVYRGEKNPLGVKRVMKASIKTSIVEGIVMSVILLGLADLVPLLFDIQTPDVVRDVAKAVRLSCIGLIATSVLFLASSYFLLLEKIGHAVLICFFKDLLMPVTFALLFSLALGIDGVWLGLSVGAVVALLASILLTMARFGKKGFPFYTEACVGKVFTFDFNITEKEIIANRDSVAELLKENNACKRTVMRSMLLIEELFMLIKEKNPNKNLMAELSVFIMESEVKFITRDDGVIFDITSSENDLLSFRTFMVNSLMNDQGPKKNLTTMSFNRNMFILPLNS